MAGNPTIRLNKVLRELNISLDRAVDYLASKGHDVEARPTTKITDEVYQVLLDEFQTDKSKKVASKEVGEEKRKEKEALRLQIEQEQEEKRIAREKRNAENQVIKAKAELSGPKTVGKIELDQKPAKPEPEEVKEEAKPVAEAAQPKAELAEKAPEVKKEAKVEVTPEVKQPETPEVQQESETIKTQYKKLSGPKITGDKSDLSKFEKPKKKKEETANTNGANNNNNNDRKKRRKRIVSKTQSGNDRFGNRNNQRRGGQRNTAPKVEPTEEEVQKQVRETLEKLHGKSNNSKSAKYRSDKRDQHRQQSEADVSPQEQ